jgi:hypothetical protein
MQTFAGSLFVASAAANSAGIGIIGSAHGDGHSAGLGDDDLVLAGSGRDLRRGRCASENEDDDESADDVFHFDYPLSCIYVSRFLWTNQMK